MGGFLGGLIRAGVQMAGGAAQGDVEGAKLKQQLAMQALAQKSQEQEQQLTRAQSEYGGATFNPDGTLLSYDPEHSKKAAYEGVIFARAQKAKADEDARQFAQQSALERLKGGYQMQAAGIEHGAGGKGGQGQPSDGERKAGAQLEGARDAVAKLDKYTEAPPAQQGLGKIPGLGNYLLSPEQQQLEMAGRALAEAYLRPFSGASISQGEIDNITRQAVPRPGDSPEVLKYKAARRQEFVRAVESAAGRAVPVPSSHASAPGVSDVAAQVDALIAKGITDPAQIKAALAKGGAQ